MSVTSALTIGMKGKATTAVSAQNTARAAGSGTADVFATPFMIALMEAASVACVEGHLPPDHMSLGTHLDVSHQAATPIGIAIETTAELTAIEGRKLTFRVEARDPFEVIGQGTHTRVVIDSIRFEEKLRPKRA